MENQSEPVIVALTIQITKNNQDLAVRYKWGPNRKINWGPIRELNPGSLTPEASIILLDQWAI